MPKTILLATLGGQPQIVTFALDILLAKGEEISDVYLLHPSTAQPRIHRALTQLLTEFSPDGDPRGERRYSCRLHCVPLVRNDMQAALAWERIRELIAEQKAAGHRLHLLIAGGRRLMGILVASASALLCDHSDSLWHIYTPDAVQARVRDGAEMHVRPADGVVLIRVPLAPWGSYFPGLRAMALASQETVTQQMGWQQRDEGPCRQVYARLSERQRDALYAFAAGGTPQDVAEALKVTLSTVNTYKTAILAECRIAWGLAEEERLTYHFIAHRFAPFLRRLGKL